MRFLSKIAGFKKVAVHEDRERLADGTYNIRAPGYVAEFQHGGLTIAEKEYARAHFTWKGLPTAPDGMALDPISDLHRVSVFDTAEIQDQRMRERVEAALLNSPSLGQDYILVEAPKQAAPWPAYDKLVAQGRRTIEMVAEKIAATVVELGLDPAVVVAYEQQNLARPEVVAALEPLVGETEPDDELVAA